MIQTLGNRTLFLRLQWYVTFVFFQIFAYTKKWTPEEDNIVINAINTYGQKKNSWNQIANHLDGKSPY